MLKGIFEKSLEYGKELFACFVDLAKLYDRVSQDKLDKFAKTLEGSAVLYYGGNVQYLPTIKSFYCTTD